MSNIDAFYSIALHHAAARAARAARARASGFGTLQDRHFAKNDIFIGPRGGTYKIINGHKSYFGARLSKSRRASQLRNKMSKLYKSAKKRSRSSRSRSPRRSRRRTRSRSPRRRRKQKGKMKVKGRVIITRPRRRSPRRSRRRSPRRSKRRPRSGPNKCRWQTEIRCRGPKAPRLCS